MKLKMCLSFQLTKDYKEQVSYWLFFFSNCHYGSKFKHAASTILSVFLLYELNFFLRIKESMDLQTTYKHFVKFTDKQSTRYISIGWLESVCCVLSLIYGELRPYQLKSKQGNQMINITMTAQNVNTFFPAQKSMRSSQINIKIPEN